MKIQMWLCLASELLVISIIVLIATPARADNKLVKVGVYENPPKIFTTETGVPQGIFIDILKYIAAKENWKLHYVGGTWKQCLERLKEGEIDLMPDVALNATRKEIFDFHQEPVLSDWFQIYAHEKSKIKSIVDLKGKSILVLENSIQQDSFKKIIAGFQLQPRLISGKDYISMFKQLKAGKVDAVITNRYFGQMWAAQYNLKDTSVIFHPTRLFYAVPKGKNQYLLEAIDSHLIHLKKNPASAYHQSLKKWTSEKIDFSFPIWAKTTVFVITVILLLSLLGSFLLKKQVDVRTKELQEANLKMEEKIRQRTEELKTAMEKAQAADYLKSAFLATMSHELRTPLNSIIGFSGLLLQELAGSLNPEQKKQLGMVKSSSHHLLSLINDVLDISKIEAGQLALSISKFKLPASLRQTLDIILPFAKTKNIEVELEISPEIQEVELDQRRFEQVFLNLLTNAVKFTEAGKIKVSCYLQNQMILLSVADTGIGIAEEKLSELFQPFHQIDSGLSRKHEGTGLGLSISKKLINMMGGTIGVKSWPGKGSTFTVTFPPKKEILNELQIIDN